MTMEQFSIILESISFLCVTLDLYGKDRLQKLQTQLSNKLDSAQKKVWQFQYLLSFLKTPYDIIFIILSLILFSIIWIKGKAMIENPWLIGVLYIYIVLISFLTMNKKKVNKILSFILSIMNKYNLDGVLLGFGTILFFLSRLLLFIK